MLIGVTKHDVRVSRGAACKHGGGRAVMGAGAMGAQVHFRLLHALVLAFTGTFTCICTPMCLFDARLFCDKLLNGKLMKLYSVDTFPLLQV